eukprot:TRINITY_DN13405_c0_g1_i4.p1 TRINITY_DN13405_c0_g1~~TRINITY_DN13405_c0_g1_i4.p1  ORF type:complete len:501 (+),score=110.62 TRINITY_DN13405_c0_g1_i4:121-1623(+)
MPAAGNSAIRAKVSMLNPASWVVLSTRELWDFAADKERRYELPRPPPALTLAMHFIAQRVPRTVAPGVLALTGLLCTVSALYIAHIQVTLGPRYPFTRHCGWLIFDICVVLLGAWYLLTNLQSAHARRIGNTSDLCSLLVSAVNSASSCFLVPTLCTFVDVTDPRVVWYFVQTVQLFFLTVHVWELRGTGSCFARKMLPDAAAIVPVFVLGILLQAAADADMLPDAPYLLTRIRDHWCSLAEVAMTMVQALPLWGPSTTSIPAFLPSCVAFYGFSLIAAVGAALRLRSAEGNDHRGPRCILLCVLFRVFSVAANNTGLWGRSAWNMATVVEDGLVLGALVTDIQLYKVTRNWHVGWMLALCVGTVMHQGAVLSLCAIYHFGVFYHLSAKMRLPILTVYVNVYVASDGSNSYKDELEAAARHGDRLIVGVVSDDGAQERWQLFDRCSRVQGHRRVCEVIEDARIGVEEFEMSPRPPHLLDFIARYNINMVVTGTGVLDVRQ